MKVLVDIHEPETITIFLQGKGLVVERTKLAVGDYQIGNILVERKEIDDFFNSVYSGRIWKQLYNMKQTELKCFLVLVGRVPYTGWSVSKHKTLRGVFLTCYLSYNICPIWLENTTEFLEWLVEIAKRASSTEVKLKPVGKKSESLPEVKADILACIPSIGRKLAEHLAKQYSIQQLANMEEIELETLRDTQGKRLGLRGRNISKYLKQ